MSPKRSRRRLRFGLGTLILLTATIATACAAWIKRDTWYIEKTIPVGYHACQVAVSPDRKRIACLEQTNPNRLRVIDFDTGDTILETSVDRQHIQYLTYTDDGQLLGYDLYRLARYDPATEKRDELLNLLAREPPEGEQIVDVSPDGQHVLLVARDLIRTAAGGLATPSDSKPKYRVRDIVSGRVLWEYQVPSTGVGVGDFSPTGSEVAVMYQGMTWIWDYREDKRLHSIPMDYALSPVLFGDDRRALIRGTIWDVQTGQPRASLDWGIYSAVPISSSFLITATDSHVEYWRRRRLEGRWGPLSFPEAWLAAALALLTLVSLFRHSRR